MGLFRSNEKKTTDSQEGMHEEPNTPKESGVSTAQERQAEEARLLEAVNEEVRRKHARLKIASLTSAEAKEELRQVILEEFHAELHGHDALVEKILRESVGLGKIEEILQDPAITDIVYNGTALVLETNEKKWQVEEPITPDYMEKIVHKLANMSGKEFTTKDPILDVQFHNLRVNAVHQSLATVGLTVAFRVSRSTLVLTEDNFSELAPIQALHLLQACVGSFCNLVLSGETGAGKTELQKCLIQSIPFDQRIALVEDVQESHVKDLFPDKDVLAWHSEGKVDMSALIKAGLRNNPQWLLVTEMRSAHEAYEWLQGLMTDHKSITTVHAVSAQAIPDRILNMILEAYPIDEARFLRTIQQYIDIGVQLRVRTIHGKKKRYIEEIVYHTPEGAVPLFWQRCTKDGHLYYNFCSALPPALAERFADYGLPVTVGEEAIQDEKETAVGH